MQYSQENDCVRVSFLKAYRPATLLKKRLQRRCFPVNTAKFVRIPILKNICVRLLVRLFFLLISLDLSKRIFGKFRVWEGNNGLNLMSQYQPCLPDKCHAIIKLFHNFEVSLWKYYNVTMHSAHFTFFTKMMQRRCNFVMPTSRRCCDFGVTVKSMLLLQHPWYAVRWNYHPKLRQSW